MSDRSPFALVSNVVCLGMTIPDQIANGEKLVSVHAFNEEAEKARCMIEQSIAYWGEEYTDYTVPDYFVLEFGQEFIGKLFANVKLELLACPMLSQRSVLLHITITEW